jgi:hypothetical protein
MAAESRSYQQVCSCARRAPGPQKVSSSPRTRPQAPASQKRRFSVVLHFTIAASDPILARSRAQAGPRGPPAASVRTPRAERCAMTCQDPWRDEVEEETT